MNDDNIMTKITIIMLNTKQNLYTSDPKIKPIGVIFITLNSTKTCYIYFWDSFSIVTTIPFTSTWKVMKRYLENDSS